MELDELKKLVTEKEADLAKKEAAKKEELELLAKAEKLGIDTKSYKKKYSAEQEEPESVNEKNTDTKSKSNDGISEVAELFTKELTKAIKKATPEEEAPTEPEIYT